MQVGSLGQCYGKWIGGHPNQPNRESQRMSQRRLDVTPKLIGNAQGIPKGPWKLTVKLYRSSLTTIPGIQIHAERTIFALTMNENVFVLIEDPAAPTRADILATIPPGGGPPTYLHGPPHYRNTLLTLRPPEALDQLLSQLKARWVPVKQAAPGSQRGQGAVSQGQQLTIDGHVFTIGNEWLVRVGNVILAGGGTKGMLLEVGKLSLAHGSRRLTQTGGISAIADSTIQF